MIDKLKHIISNTYKFFHLQNDIVMYKPTPVRWCLFLLLSIGCYGNPLQVSVSIQGIIPHKSLGFTQGLIFHKGFLYEGTGLHGSSHLYEITAEDGAIKRSRQVQQFFGEGITIINNKLYQLTWQANQALVYDYPALTLCDTLHYEGEGWGLTHDTSFLIMSNGSDTLYFRDTAFKVKKKVAVTIQNVPVNHLNELEYAHGNIYANIWYKNYILKINPQSGKTISKIDCTPLFQIEQPAKKEQVLNGIAYNHHKNTFYLTGKHWKYIFEVSIP